jgi:type III secretion protein D
MDNAVATRDPLQALELRVFEGPQHGARAALATGVGCVIASHPDGHVDGADVVLREEGVAPVRVRVTVDMRDAMLEVLEGEVQLGGEMLTAGAQAAWGMHAPLKIGGSMVAFGRAGNPKWPGAAASAPHEEPAEDSTPPVARKPRTPLSRRPEVWLAAMGGLVLLICGAAFGTALLAAPPPTETVAPPPLAVALRGSEFSTLQAGTRKDGKLELHGRLDSEELRSRLDSWLAERQLTPAIDVQVDETLVRNVTETFRVNGVSVQAQVLGAGMVSVEAADPSADHLARAEEVVRRDVRGLTKLVVRNTVQAAKKPLPPMAEDPGKRIASLVAGDPAYLVTADGSRYFVGSMLPSGHRVAAIGSSSVTLEHDGEKTTLNF